MSPVSEVQCGGESVKQMEDGERIGRTRRDDCVEKGYPSSLEPRMMWVLPYWNLKTLGRDFV